MFKLKFVLPMLAFVLAIGMSFAFVGETSDENLYATKYILLDPTDPSNLDSWAEINVECALGSNECTVEYMPSGQTFWVYNSPNLNDRAESDQSKVIVDGPPPTQN